MPPFIDHTGRRFGKLAVIRRSTVPYKSAAATWLCRCDCGNETIIRAYSIGKTRSCGCLGSTHGKSSTALYAIYRGIINRCENPNVRAYPLYGGRGIKICAEWRNDFKAFEAHVGPRPSKKHSIDRIDTNGDYEPGNVRWATPVQQCNNRRKTRWVIYRGEEMPLAEAVRAAGSVIHIEAAYIRLRSGWTPERALETPRLHLSGNAKDRREVL